MWIARGRLDDARRLLADRTDHPDSVLPLAPLRLADGAYADAVVVARLHNSVRTIEHHVGEILAGLGLRGRAEAAVYAVSLQVKEAVE
ncbi:MAG TPA: hypothetical protein VIU11_28315 [Nakamurella sp.]